MSRDEAVSIITQVHYGAPGEDYRTDVGDRIIMDLLAQTGLEALTDDAVIRLAGMHLAEDERSCREAERKWRRDHA